MALTVAEFEEKIRKAFDNADVNKNGALEKDEARGLAQKIAQNNGNEFEEEKFSAMFDANKNADGRLTFDVFYAKAKARAIEKGLVAE